MNKLFSVMVFVLLVLSIACLCTTLDREQELLKITKLNTYVAEQRAKTAKVEFINELYRFERYKQLFNDAVHKDDWQAEVEQLKQENGYYND